MPRRTALARRNGSVVRLAAASADARTTVTEMNERPNPSRMPTDRRRPPVDAAPNDEREDRCDARAKDREDPSGEGDGDQDGHVTIVAVG